MKPLLMALVLACSASLASAADYAFEGPWKTTNRKLDGIMTSEVTKTGEEQWKGRFYGVWQGVAFDYNVAFTGPADQLRGTATIDGAHYDWTGTLSTDRFQGSFTGSRYTGYFDLKEKKAKAAN